MQLNPPVTVQPDSYTRPKTGEVRHIAPLTVPHLDVTVTDNPMRKSCMASLQFPFDRASLVLWEGEKYDAAGDYTQAQVDARVLELLGPDVAAGLKGLLR
jgi:hypothetical protein